MKKRDIHLLWALPCMIILLASCSAESPDSDGQVPLCVSAATVMTGGLQSRAATDVTSGSIGVFRLADNGYTAYNNVEYVYSAGWASLLPIYLDSRKASVVAYYPYGSVTFSGTVATLTAQGYDETKDMYYAALRGVVNNANPTAAFNMTRAYARLKLEITRMDTYDAAKNCAITNVNLKSATIFYSVRTLDFSTGLWGGTPLTGGWTYALNTGNLASGATNKDFDVLLPSQEVINGLTLTLTVDGVDRAVTIPGSKFDNQLQSGHEYVIGLQIRDTELTVTEKGGAEAGFDSGTNPGKSGGGEI